MIFRFLYLCLFIYGAYKLFKTFVSIKQILSGKGSNYNGNSQYTSSSTSSRRATSEFKGKTFDTSCKVVKEEE